MSPPPGCNVRWLPIWPIKRREVNDLILADKAANWHRLKSLVLDSVSPITKRVYNLALDEFIEWFGKEPRLGFTKATVSAWRVALEGRGLRCETLFAILNNRVFHKV